MLIESEKEKLREGVSEGFAVTVWEGAAGLIATGSTIATAKIWVEERFFKKNNFIKSHFSVDKDGRSWGLVRFFWADKEESGMSVAGRVAANSVFVRRREIVLGAFRWINRGLTLVTIFLLFVYIPRSFFELLKKEKKMKKVDRKIATKKDMYNATRKKIDELHQMSNQV